MYILAPIQQPLEGKAIRTFMQTRNGLTLTIYMDVEAITDMT